MSAASMVDAAADLDCECGPGARATEARSGEESALLVRSPEQVNGGVFERPSLVPKNSFKEPSSDCSECSNGGAKGAAPPDCVQCGYRQAQPLTDVLFSRQSLLPRVHRPSEPRREVSTGR